MRHLVSYQEFTESRTKDSTRGWGPFSGRMEALGLLPSIWPSVKLCSLWLRHLVCYQECTISPRLGLGMCGTLTLNQWALWSSLRLSNPWLRHLSTRSWCHTKCEIKALVILSVYDDVLWVVMKDHLDHLHWPQGTWRRLKAKVKNYIRTFGPQVKVKNT